MDFIGEHLLPGQLGHLLAILSFVASLVASIAYFKASQQTELATDKHWQTIGRWAFGVETMAVFSLFAILFYIIFNHYFEYKYAWQHSQRSLQLAYIFSCFWEGQEGSFMLWSFWHCVLGWILIKTARKWEAPTMTVVSFVQACLATMVLGIYFFDVKIGSSPFVLLRNELEAPIFQQADYLSKIKDGQGLNVLLQNYWMVIHPPILFLGFASTVVPFAFAIGGLIKRDFTSWTKQALPWAAFSAGILGVGIMMGAAWAYESLTFGGYWAWDPVENASMVPWLVLVAGMHTNLIYNHSGYSLRATYWMYLLSFLLVLYSTFLTRSGILGDTSVHAFTDLGMNVQLLLFLLIFLVPSVFLLLRHYKKIPTIVKEEAVSAREFWMFIGSLLFFLTALFVIGQTSLPVFNKILGTKWAIGKDVEFAYNRVTIFVVVVVAALTAFTQYLKYKETPTGFARKKLLWPTVATLVIGLLISFFYGIRYDKQGIGFQIAIYLALFTSIYAVVANAAYVFNSLKGRLKFAGGSVAHVGFGLMLVGILISSSNKKVLSYNTTGFSPIKDNEREKPAENLSLIKGINTDMGDWMVEYSRDTFNNSDRKKYYELRFAKKDSSEHFNLYPDVIQNNKGSEGLSANPDKKHYWHKDIFTYLTYILDPKDVKDTSAYKKYTLKIGDSVFYSNGLLILNKVVRNPQNQRYQFSEKDAALMADITVIGKNASQYKAQPALQVVGDNVLSLPDTVMAQSLAFRFESVSDVQEGSITIGVKESQSVVNLVTLKALEFPWINLVWLGVIVMFIGFVMSAWRRRQQLRVLR
jgi:cytochrome c-type biogenesis protein CcmF